MAIDDPPPRGKARKTLTLPAKLSTLGVPFRGGSVTVGAQPFVTTPKNRALKDVVSLVPAQADKHDSMSIQNKTPSRK